MTHRLDKPLTRPITLRSDPPRTLDTLLAAVEFLNAGSQPKTAEVDAALDLIIAAASSGEPTRIKAVTEILETIVRKRGEAIAMPSENRPR